jgi:hypothetical protein
MSGKKGRSGCTKRILYSRVHRISLGESERDLLPFFEALDKLPAGKRSAALFAAIRGGQGAAEQALTRTESGKTSRAIDALLDAFE